MNKSLFYVILEDTIPLEIIKEDNNFIENLLYSV
jgi:hypothetical protein